MYFEKGDMERARGEFEKVLQITPQHNEAREFLDSIIQKVKANKAIQTR